MIQILNVLQDSCLCAWALHTTRLSWIVYMKENTEVVRFVLISKTVLMQVSLDVTVEILAVIGEEDGVARWLS